MALILRRKASKQATSTEGQSEGTPETFLAAPMNDTSASLPSARAATAPKKLVIKGKKKPETPTEAPDKAAETPETKPNPLGKAYRALGMRNCTFCGNLRKDPCDGSEEWRGSTDKDGNRLQCADKRRYLNKPNLKAVS